MTLLHGHATPSPHMYREPFSSTGNQAVPQKLKENASVLLPDTPSALITGVVYIIVLYLYLRCGVMYGLVVVSISAAAAGTYYTSYIGSERLKNSGKYKDKCAQQRRRNRLVRVHITLYTYLSFFNYIFLIVFS